MTNNDIKDDQCILVTVSGPDQPGITKDLMKVLASNKIPLLDMGQSVTHGLLSLSFLLEVSSSNSKGMAVVKDLLFEAKKRSLSLDFDIVNKTLATPLRSKERFILNCVSTDQITTEFLHDIADVLSSNKVNIQRIDTVSPNAFQSLEFLTTMPDGIDWQAIKSDLLKVSSNHQIDVAFLKDNVWRRNKRLIVFDMDSTLIQTEVIDELAKLAGIGDKVKAITERAMNGEIDFDESLIERVSLLKGVKKKELYKIIDKLPITPGAKDFISKVKSLCYKTAVISGGFTIFADAIKEKLGLDFAFANELEFSGDELTGKVVGQIVNANQKALLLKLLVQQLEINLEQVVAIGDGANDLPMLSTAGLGIAYHAKEIVKKKADNHMSHGPMTTILYFLGIPEGSYTHSS